MQVLTSSSHATELLSPPQETLTSSPQLADNGSGFLSRLVKASISDTGVDDLPEHTSFPYFAPVKRSPLLGYLDTFRGKSGSTVKGVKTKEKQQQEAQTPRVKRKIVNVSRIAVLAPPPSSAPLSATAISPVLKKVLPPTPNDSDYPEGDPIATPAPLAHEEYRLSFLLRQPSSDLSSTDDKHRSTSSSRSGFPFPRSSRGPGLRTSASSETNGSHNTRPRLVSNFSDWTSAPSSRIPSLIEKPTSGAKEFDVRLLEAILEGYLPTDVLLELASPAEDGRESDHVHQATRRRRKECSCKDSRQGKMVSMSTQTEPHEDPIRTASPSVSFGLNDRKASSDSLPALVHHESSDSDSSLSSTSTAELRTPEATTPLLKYAEELRNYTQKKLEDASPSLKSVSRWREGRELFDKAGMLIAELDLGIEVLDAPARDGLGFQL